MGVGGKSMGTACSGFPLVLAPTGVTAGTRGGTPARGKHSGSLSAPLGTGNLRPPEKRHL